MYSVLIVDENEDSRFVLRNLLEAEGVAAWAEPNAGAALRRCEAEGRAPDIAVVDVVLSQPHGFEFPRTLRERYPDIPLILISGTPLNLLVLDGYFDPTAVEPYVFLEKPFTPQSFRQKLQDAMAILAGRLRLNRAHQS